MMRRLLNIGISVLMVSALALIAWIAEASFLGHGEPRISGVKIYGGSLAASVNGNGNGSNSGNGSGSSPPGKSFSIGGSMSGLYPGGTFPLVLSFVNSKPFAITVSNLVITAGDASSACKASNLQIGGAPSTVNVPGNSSAQTNIYVTLVRSAPNACQGVVFPLSYSAQAAQS